MDTPVQSTPRAAWSVAEFCVRYNVSKAQAFIEMREGRLQRVKLGRRTLIPIETAEVWWQALQKAS